MRLKFTDPREGATSDVQGRWQRQSGQRAASGGSSGSGSESTGPYTSIPNPLITPKPPTQTPSADAVTVSVKNITFTGSRKAYNPLFDREGGVKITPPQWRRTSGNTEPFRNEPISYVQGGRATVKLDITGSPSDLKGRSVLVRVTPTAKLLKKTLPARGKSQLVPYEPPQIITFTPRSKMIKVTNWDNDDSKQLEFTSSLLPNEIRLDELQITWRFEYQNPSTKQWIGAGTESTSHEMYITYAKPYHGFKPSRYPWKEVLREACSYAHGTNSKVTASSLVTTRMYDSLRYRYYGSRSHSAYDDSNIKLWDMLRDGWMDCRDGAHYYTIMMQWLGIKNARQVKINEEHGDAKGFYFKPLRPISASNNPTVGWLLRNRKVRSSNWWFFHQVGILGGRIYDPIIKVNEAFPRVPANMTRGDYKRDLFDPFPFHHPTDQTKNRVGTFPWAKPALVREVV